MITDLHIPPTSKGAFRDGLEMRRTSGIGRSAAAGLVRRVAGGGWRISRADTSGKRTLPQGESRLIKPNPSENEGLRRLMKKLGREVGECGGKVRTRLGAAFSRFEGSARKAAEGGVLRLRPCFPAPLRMTVFSALALVRCCRAFHNPIYYQCY